MELAAGAAAHLEASKERELEVRVRRATKLLAMAAMTIYPSWTLFDMLLAPQWWKTFATLRFLQAGVIAVAYAAWRVERMRTETFIYIAFLGMAFQIAFMCAVVPIGVSISYFLGFSTLFLAAGIIVLWRPIHSAIVLLLSLPVLLLANVLYEARPLSVLVQQGGLMFLTLAIVSVLVTRMRWQMVREEIDARARMEDAHHALERQAAELASSNRELERFARAVSHDLKTPINRLSLAVDVLEDPSLDEPARRETMQVMRRAITAASRTIDELLQAAWAEPAGAPGGQHAADLADVYAEVESELGEEVRKGGGRAEADFDAGRSVAVERGKLKSILQNLMTNAVKFRSPCRPLEIRVRSTRAEGFVVLSVSDNGLGMELARRNGHALPHLVRLHPEIQGSGLGLGLVNDMVETAGGRIEVESALDRGTTFRVWLPESQPQKAG
jgi:signal transduction histidine kinase